jgi:hypothetical protein
MRAGARAATRSSLRLVKDNLCDSVEPRNVWLPAETSRLSFMRLCHKLGIAAVVLLLACISAYPASTRNRIDPGPVIGLMRAEAPRCAVVCGISCIRPWAPYNDTPFPMPDGGGLFECLRSGPVTPHPSGASSKPLLQAVQGRALARPALLRFVTSASEPVFAVSRACHRRTRWPVPAYRVPAMF